MTMNRRAEDFEKALSGRAPIDPAMAALVAVAGALAAVPQQPTPAFREGLRAKLMAEAASLAAAPAAVPAAAAAIPAQAAGSALRNVLAKPAMQAATGTLAVAVGVTGVGVGASRSLPGDALYGLKRSVEGLQVRLAGDPAAEAEALLEHAQTRLAEVQALLDRGGADAVALVEDTLADLKSELDDATARLLAAAQGGSRAAYDRLKATADAVNRQLVALLPSLPDEAKATASAAMSTLNVAKARLAAIPLPPLPGGPSVTPPAGVTPTHVPTTPSVTTTPSVPGGPTITTPPITITTPPITVTPPPISVSPPPVTVGPPTIQPPTVTLTPLPPLPITLPPL